MKEAGRHKEDEDEEHVREEDVGAGKKEQP